ncbi:MAG TPA: hypothetical protein PK760_10985 [Flavobacteriales bacterium]|nr:hypothetical protein [Flavobacteriales bacterium]
MRTFLLKCAVAIFLALACNWFAAYWADGDADAFYLRFTDGRKGSLVLGTSRAAQGIRPSVMAEALHHQGPALFNYAFTIAHSPFGATYTRAILAKLDTTTRHGMFVVTVDPWSVADNVMEDGSTGEPIEASLMLGEQCDFTATPNREYLVRNAREGWGSFIGGPHHHPDTMLVLHPDGWLQLRAPLDSTKVKKRTLETEAKYRKEMLPKYRPGSARVNSLDSLLTMLQQHGTVVMLRIPVGDRIAAMEEQFDPEFTGRMEQLSGKHGIPYWDLLPERDRYTYVDGMHLDTVSSRRFSLELAARLNALPGE